jgi:hypothetical protein
MFSSYFSYKLWYSYLCLRRKQTKGRCITDSLYEDANNTFERALVFMHKVTICQLYCILLNDSTLLIFMCIMNAIDAKNLDGLLQVFNSSTKDYYYKKGF